LNSLLVLSSTTLKYLKSSSSIVRTGERENDTNKGSGEGGMLPAAVGREG
jgi:hypothetical protein